MVGTTLQLMEWNMPTISCRIVLFKNCKSVNGFPRPPHRWYLKPPLVKNNNKATVYCNTSAAQFFSAQSSTDAVDPIRFNYRPNPPDILGVFNYPLLQQWAQSELNVLQQLFVPYRQSSPFQMALQQSNLSELHLSYYGISSESLYSFSTEEGFLFANTPANDYWTLEISYTPNAGPPQQYLHIAFLPNGSLDLIHTSSSDLEVTNKLLAPTMAYLQVTPLQFWEVVNWLFVTFYWTILADLGQAVPTTYPIDLNGEYVFSSPSTYLPTNNIFINETLYQIYSSFLHPTGDVPSLNRTIGAGLPNMTFIKSYSCTQRQLKSPINFIISVAVANYALIMGGYSFAILIAGSIQKHRRKDGKLLLFRDLLN